MAQRLTPKKENFSSIANYIPCLTPIGFGLSVH